jgi:anti-anti-sigma factor
LTESAYLTVDITRRAHRCVVVVDGELDASNSSVLSQHLQRVVATGEVRIVVDASKLRFCDLAGVRVLHIVAQRCTAAGGWLRLAAPPRHLEWVLAVTRLQSQLPAYRSVAGAAAATDAERISGWR